MQTIGIIQFIYIYAIVHMKFILWIAKYFSCDKWSNFQVEAINFPITRETHAKEKTNIKKPFQQKREDIE